IEATIRHHALESGCFVVNATGWLSDEQVTALAPDPNLRKALRGGCWTAIISPEGVPLAPPLREGEGMVIADLDFALITKRKRMMDSVGHYARPELLSLNHDTRPATPLSVDATAAAASLAAPASLAATATPPSPITDIAHERSDSALRGTPDHRDPVARTSAG
ncbi:MAG: aliphatic nitrilase, partial [Burkholderiales bacterium]|nr:aliphatic nitrilase [Burkholderiales bacterium]